MILCQMINWTSLGFELKIILNHTTFIFIRLPLLSNLFDYETVKENGPHYNWIESPLFSFLKRLPLQINFCWKPFFFTTFEESLHTHIFFHQKENKIESCSSCCKKETTLWKAVSSINCFLSCFVIGCWWIKSW